MKCYAVIDTNVLVSYLLTKNRESSVVKVMELVKEGIIIPMLHTEITKEYNEVLRRCKFGIPEQTINDLIGYMTSLGIFCDRKETNEYLPDPDDIAFYEVSLSVEDSYLITGNLKHFPKNGHVVTPAEMLQIIHLAESKGNTDKAIYGKLVTFGEEYNLNGDKNTDEMIFTYNVIGKIGNEDGNIIDTNSGGNEYRDITVPTFQDGTRLDRWSCILAESLSSGSDIRAAYRVTDHYMAPVIQGGEQFTVSPNPRYNGEMFSQFPVGGILIALAVAVFSFIKLLCFIELCVDIMLLFVNLALGSAQSIASGRSQVMDVAKRLGSDILRVMIYDVFVTLLIYASSVTNNGGQAALGVLSAAAVVGLYRMISYSHSAGILTPGLFTVFEAVSSRAKSVIHGIEEENAEAENNKREIERDLATIKRMRMDNKASYSGTRATVDMSGDSGVSEDNNVEGSEDAEDGSTEETPVESDDATIVDAGADNKRN